MNEVEFRDADLVRGLADKIATQLGGDKLRFMHVCGTHEHAISRYALRSLLPDGFEIIGGPGCPVCVCPSTDIDQAIDLVRRDMIICTFGDMIRVPSDRGSLADMRVEGGDVRVVGSVVDAVQIAVDEPERQVVFFAVGFETPRIFPC